MSVDDPLLQSLRIQRIALDSEELGNQRETIQKLNSTDRSHGNSMSRRATTNNVAMVLVVALLLAILIIILALKT